MSQKVPWTDPGGVPCCCLPACENYPGPPDIPSATVSDATFASPWSYVQSGVERHYPDRYDLSVFNISPTIYNSLLAGGTWTYNIELQSDVVDGEAFQVSEEQTFNASSSCSLQASPIISPDDYSSVSTEIESQLWLDSSNASNRKAKILFSPEIRANNWPSNGLTFNIKFLGLFWPVEGTNDPARINDFYPATYTINVGGSSFVFDNSDGFYLIQSLWPSTSSSLDIDATFTPAAP